MAGVRFACGCGVAVWRLSRFVVAVVSLFSVGPGAQRWFRFFAGVRLGAFVPQPFFFFFFYFWGPAYPQGGFFGPQYQTPHRKQGDAKPPNQENEVSRNRAITRLAQTRNHRIRQEVGRLRWITKPTQARNRQRGLVWGSELRLCFQNRLQLLAIKIARLLELSRCYQGCPFFGPPVFPRT